MRMNRILLSAVSTWALAVCWFVDSAALAGCEFYIDDSPKVQCKGGTGDLCLTIRGPICTPGCSVISGPTWSNGTGCVPADEPGHYELQLTWTYRNEAGCPVDRDRIGTIKVIGGEIINKWRSKPDGTDVKGIDCGGASAEPYTRIVFVAVPKVQAGNPADYFWEVESSQSGTWTSYGTWTIGSDDTNRVLDRTWGPGLYRICVHARDFDAVAGQVDCRSNWCEFTVFAVDVLGAAPTIDGTTSGPFAAVVYPVVPASYNWTWEAPSGAGNNPQVNFTSGTSQSTTITNAHWFALPDNRLADVTGFSCQYAINCSVTYKGETGKDLTPPGWIVYLPEPPGVTRWPWISGWPATSTRQENGQTVWYVTGIGSLARIPPAVVPYIPATSQFYNKVITVHEGRHVEQWTSISPWKDLFDAQALYTNVISYLTSTIDQRDLDYQIEHAISSQNSNDSNAAGHSSEDRERDAFDKSNAVAPDYLEYDIP